ncbi:MAG: hypothetical protein K1X78_20350 [Verrucomicrobiaceae bacterium]|nr:hypothetical protein [Verrucomicrobiaceae bacterium]
MKANAKKAPDQLKGPWNASADNRARLKLALESFKKAGSEQSFGFRELTALAAQLLPTITPPESWAGMSSDERLHYFGVSDPILESGEFPVPRHPQGFTELAVEAVNRAALLLWAVERKFNIWGTAHEMVLPEYRWFTIVRKLRETAAVTSKEELNIRYEVGLRLLSVDFETGGRLTPISEVKFLELAFLNKHYAEETKEALWQEYIGHRKLVFDRETSERELFAFLKWFPENVGRISKALQRKRTKAAAVKGGRKTAARRARKDGTPNFTQGDTARLDAAAGRAKPKRVVAAARKKLPYSA